MGEARSNVQDNIFSHSRTTKIKKKIIVGDYPLKTPIPLIHTNSHVTDQYLLLLFLDAPTRQARPSRSVHYSLSTA
jgi:hypothetical protein